MITSEELRKYSKRTKYNLGQTEKDLLQHHVLSFIEMMSGNSLAFKGGTCLQKVFSLDRFSEDLDFSLNEKGEKTPDIEDIIGHLDTIGYPADLRPVTRKRSEGSKRILIEGPLFDGRPISKCSITIDISARSDLIKEPIVKRLVPIYAEISPYLIYHMDISEIMAEKIRALLTREKARDLYDLHFLIQKGITTDRTMVDAKLSHYSLTIDKELIKKGIVAKKGIWKRELRPLLVQEVPDYRYVSEEVRQWLETLLMG